jgi:hypothetical protein
MVYETFTGLIFDLLVAYKDVLRFAFLVETE